MTTDKQTIKVTKAALPASCPPKGTEAWDLHPRVYIKLDGSEAAKCPYCGNQFELTD